MDTDAAQRQPIVRLTRWETSFSMPARCKRQDAEARRFTYYGVDADGVEHVYAEHDSEEVDKQWRATDPLWREAHSRTMQVLLADPATRDTVLRINIKAALDAGDTETAVSLARHLSPRALREILGTESDRRKE